MITIDICAKEGKLKIVFAFGALNYFCCIVFFRGERDVQNDSF